MTLQETRDYLLKTSEYKGTEQEVAYAIGVIDLYNMIYKETTTSSTMAKAKKQAVIGSNEGKFNVNTGK